MGIAQRLEPAAFVVCILGFGMFTLVLLVFAFLVSPREISKVFLERFCKKKEPDMRHPLQPRRTTNHPGFWSSFGESLMMVSREIELKKERKAKRLANKRKKVKGKKK